MNQHEIRRDVTQIARAHCEHGCIMYLCFVRLTCELARSGCPDVGGGAGAVAMWLSTQDVQQLSDLDSIDCEALCAGSLLNEHLVEFIEKVVHKITEDGGAIARATTNGEQQGNVLYALSTKRKKVHAADPPVHNKKGPTARTKLLANAADRGWDPEEWCERARVNALVGSCSKSLREAQSAYRCWVGFAGSVLRMKGNYLPPTVDGLLAWSTVFDNSDTFGNYLSKLRLMCHLAKVPTTATLDPSITRAKKSIKKRGPPPRPRRFIGAQLTARLMKLAVEENDNTAAMFYLTCYTFLLRARSEAIPMCMGTTEQATLAEDKHSCLRFVNNELVLSLASRKNMPHGSVMKRGCWCKGGSLSRSLCPVHELGMAITRDPNSTPFSTMSADKALRTLRRRLAVLNIEAPETYMLHDFRRGHTEDLRAAGAPLWQILQAGQWKSPAFLEYTDANRCAPFAIPHAVSACARSCPYI